MLLFADFEASSLYHGSFPVEAAWCSHDLAHGWSAVIRPVPEWEPLANWSPASERLHGRLRLADIEHGVPVNTPTHYMLCRRP